MLHYLRTLAIALFIFPLTVSAQDLHYTMYDLAPLMFNPAATGAFEGSFRVGGLYRDQWSISSSVYQSPSFYIDAPVLKGLGKYDWIGIGMSVFSDNAGGADLKYAGFLGSASYHFAFDKKRNTTLGIGIQGGNTQRSFDPDKANFGDEWRGGQFTPGPSSMDESNMGNDASGLEINGGVLLTSRLNDQMDFSLGLGVFHINQPDYGLTTRNDKVPMRLSLHGRYNIKLTEKWLFSPGFLFQNIGPSDEIQIQALGGYIIDPDKEITLRFGGGYRLRDAGEVILGFEYQNLRVGAAYDIPTSDVTNATSRGSFELGVSYIVKIFKTPSPDPIIFCPRL